MLGAMVIVREGHSSTILVVISALAGIAGALVGGAVSGVFNLRGEDKRQRFAEAADRQRVEHDEVAHKKHVTGISRVLTAQLKIVKREAELSVELNAWWPAQTVERPGLPPDDLKLLAGEMSAEGWMAVENALTTANLLTIRRGHFPDTLPETGNLPALDAPALATLPVAIEIFTIAVEELGAVGGG